MRIMIVVALVLAFISFMAGAKDAAKKTKAKKVIPVTATTTPAPAAAPCDTKEDILKKLEAEKKAKEAGEKPKAFSLQGNNTGCSVK
jgi:hypothetical protein